MVKKDSIYSFIESEEVINDVEVRDYLKRKLETFKIPNKFYSIKEIPRSANQTDKNNALIKFDSK